MADLRGVITEIRERLGLSQAEMARRLGLSPSTISQREKGLQGVPPSELHRMAQLAGVTLVLGEAGWEIAAPGSKAETIATMAAREACLREELERLKRLEPAGAVQHALEQLERLEGEQTFQAEQERKFGLGAAARAAMDEFAASAEVGAGPARVNDDVDEETVVELDLGGTSLPVRLAEQMLAATQRLARRVDDLVRVNGDSLHPVLCNGDVVGVRFCSEKDVRQGRLVIARWRGQGASIVKIYRGRYEDKLLLSSLNPPHEVILGDPEELEIVGRPYGLVRVNDLDLVL